MPTGTPMSHSNLPTWSISIGANSSMMAPRSSLITDGLKCTGRLCAYEPKLGTCPADDSAFDIYKRSALMEKFLMFRCGVSKGDVVSYSLVNSVDNICLFLALMSIGATICPLNPKYTSVEIYKYLSDLKPKIIFVHRLQCHNSSNEESIVSAVVEAQKDLAENMHIYIDLADLSEFDSFHDAGGADADNSMKRRILTVDSGDCSPAPSMLLHTGGTTGLPKVVPIYKRSIVASLHAIRDSYSFTKTDIGMLVMPLFHVHGLMCTLASVLLGGGAVAVPSTSGFSASRFYDEAIRVKATWYTAVPSIHEILSRQRFVEGSWPSLRFIRCCSSPLSTELYNKLKARHSVDIVQAYGMTEACHQISTQRLGFENSPGSVGWPNHDLEVCILDESWSEVEGSVEGRICLRGRQVTPGYLNNTSANASCFSDSGFFDTGDLGRKLSSGEVTLTGRMKEMVNCGGEKINPSEVEECIKSISSNVVNAVVFPVNDAILGEVPHAAVIYNTSELLDECAVQKIVIEGLQGVLASFKIPRKVYLTNKFNMSPVGKLQRSLVKKQFVKE
eukprot:GHVH01000604.1.p1 GENE.GHVH01000604.1~~GHVH01000604.1.p1  ORF type:complete len:560 (-),score=54.45 GHVH01000604.1:149-1828(-)